MQRRKCEFAAIPIIEAFLPFRNCGIGRRLHPALPEGTVDGLLEDPTGPLAEILTYHVVEGAVMSADVVGLDGQEVTTVNGATFTVNVADDGSVSITDATGNEVGVVQTDIETSNGVIHVIDGVLMPA